VEFYAQKFINREIFATRNFATIKILLEILSAVKILLEIL
jgi:hypothetical protein